MAKQPSSVGIANMPGPGGSPGMCVLCGHTFLSEILLNRKVRIIHVEGMDKDACIHDKCFKVLKKNGPDWHTLPEGPLRSAYLKASEEQAAQREEVR